MKSIMDWSITAFKSKQYLKFSKSEYYHVYEKAQEPIVHLPQWGTPVLVCVVNSYRNDKLQQVHHGAPTNSCQLKELLGVIESWPGFLK